MALYDLACSDLKKNKILRKIENFLFFKISHKLLSGHPTTPPQHRNHFGAIILLKFNSCQFTQNIKNTPCFHKFHVYVCSHNVVSLLFLAYCGSPIHNSLTLPVLDFHQNYHSKVISVLWGSGRMSREQFMRNFEKSKNFRFFSIFPLFHF